MALLSVAAALVAVAAPLAVVASMHHGQAPVGPASQTTSVSTPSRPPEPTSDSPSLIIATATVPSPRLRALLQQIQAGIGAPRSMFYPAPVGNHLYLCQLALIGPSGPHTLYAWATCGVFSTGPRAKRGASTSLPMVLHVEGTGAKTRLLSAEAPAQETWAEDYRRLFPPRIRKAFSNWTGPWFPTEDQLLAIARAPGDASSTTSDAATP
jgi:hypothetical protein